MDYGAKCDDRADDTAAFQAALAAWRERESLVGRGGTFEIPAGICRVAEPLLFGRSDGQFVSGTVHGEGQGTSMLRYLGPPGTTALTFQTFKYGAIRDFKLVGSGKAGGQRGLHLTHSAFGMGTNDVDVSHVHVQGFATGVQIGAGQSAAAELLFEGLTVDSSGTCILGESWNTLDLVFVRLNLSGCDVGVRVSSGYQWTFLGGAGSGNGRTFEFRTVGNFSITGWREEVPTGDTWLLVGGTTSLAQVAVRESQVVAPRAPGFVSIRSTFSAAITVVNSRLDGPLSVCTCNGGLVMEQTGVLAASESVRYYSPGWGGGIYVRQRGNWRPVGPNDQQIAGWWPDNEGYRTAAGVPQEAP